MSDPLRLEVASHIIDARVEVPGSKSIANRALICAALAHGTSTLTCVAPGDDTVAMVQCLGLLGVDISIAGTTAEIVGTTGSIRGGAELNAQLAGTTSRFISALAALSVQSSIVTGADALRQRPMKPLHDALRTLGATVDCLGAPDHLPVRISGGNLIGGVVQMPGDVSSQFVTALMLIAPLLPHGLQIFLTSPLISRPYLSITASVMSSFGIAGIGISDSHILIEPAPYSGRKYGIEPDASSASYPLAAAAIAGGRVHIPGLTDRALQGDAQFVDLLVQMGCRVERNHGGTTVVSGVELRGLDIDMSDMSDLVPTLCAVAAFASSPTRISGVGFIRHKESDRIGDLVRGMNALGCDAVEQENGILIRPVAPSSLYGCLLPSHDDHRLAMTWSLFALRVPNIAIDEPSVVTKSWPDWWAIRSAMIAI